MPLQPNIRIWTTPLGPAELLTEHVRYIARGALHTSPLRGQGPEGIVAYLRTWWNQTDRLEAFRRVNQQEFRSKLDELTQEMALQFQIHGRSAALRLPQPVPEGRKRKIKVRNWDIPNWGASRKVINLILNQAVRTQTIATAYGMGELGPYLEAPLDNFMIGFLREQTEALGFGDAERRPLDQWTKIYKLEKPLSEQIQEIAERVADALGCKRYELDYLAWRDPDA